MIIYNFGSINSDHVYRVPHLVKPGETLSSNDYKAVLGGKGANQSIALAKAGANTCHIGRYHQADTWIFETLTKAGVDCHLLQTTNTPTGHAIIQVDDNGQNAIILYTGANHSFTSDDLRHSLHSAQNGDWLLLQNETNQLETAIQVAVEKNLKLAINTAPMGKNILNLPLDKFEVILVNEIEASELFDLPEQNFLDVANLIESDILSKKSSLATLDVINQSINKLCPNTAIVITLGAKGAIAWDKKQWVYSSAQSVPVVDTTAAGDTFTGYFLTAFSKGESMMDSMQWASKASALCIQKAGASVSIPSLEEVKAQSNSNERKSS